jgi:pimeloyl-ACP methyl ester carboxylesterase
MRCELERIAVHYEAYGEGRPGWRRIYPDLPGMGQTPGPEWLTTEDQVLEVLLAFIDTVIPDQRFVMAGLSYGGLLTRGVVHRRAA